MLATATTLYALPILVLFLSVADIALGHHGALPAGATTTALVSFTPIAMVEILRAHSSPGAPLIPATLRRNAAPLLAMGSLAFFALTLSILPGAVWDEGSKWILLIPYGYILTLLAVVSSSNQAIRALLPIATCISLSLLLWSINCDLVTPGTFGDPNERAAGFSGNANYTALITVMLCAVSLDYDGRRLLLVDLCFLLLTFSIVLISLSRSGLLNACALLAGFLALRFLRRPPTAREVRSILLSLCAVALLLAIASPFVSSQVIALQKQSRFERALAGKKVDDGSAASRLAAARDAIIRINLAPILGHGTGYARRMPELPHNIYLQQWVNNGVFGLVGYLAFLGVSLLQFWSRRFMPGVMLMTVTIIGGFFSHNILDQRPFLILYGLALGFSSQRAVSPAKSR